MSPGENWWETLMPWLDAIRVSIGGVAWSGCQPSEGVVNVDSAEGPITIRSIFGGTGPYHRRTQAACAEYALDLFLVSDLLPHTVEWSVTAPLLKPVRPTSFPRPGVPLPLESRWAVEWRTDTGPLVRTSGESRRGVLSNWDRDEAAKTQSWKLSRRGDEVLFLACHEPGERVRVRSLSAVMEWGRYTVRVTGGKFFDYWMLDPAHAPEPLRVGGERTEVGSGWGFVRLERGKETAYGSLRKGGFGE
jgi:hypothetical protein